LNNKSPLIEAASLEVQYVVPYLKVLDSLLVTIQHHQTAPDVILKNCIVNRLHLQRQSISTSALFEASEGILKLFHVIEADSHSDVWMGPDCSFD